MVDKKGRLAALAVIVVLAIVGGLVAGASMDILDLSSNLGAWELSYVRAVQNAERDILLIELEAQDVMQKATQRVVDNSLEKDLGCGEFTDTILLNAKEKFCELNVDDAFILNTQKSMQARVNIEYDVELVGNDALFKTDKKVYEGSFDAIPTERTSCGLFCSYDAYLNRPFKLRYETNANFRHQLPEKMQLLRQIPQKSQLLVAQCANQVDLQDCLDSNKPAVWEYDDCEVPQYVEDNRKVTFCVDEMYFALDFSQGNRKAKPADQLVS